jgi:hypothetical protein
LITNVIIGVKIISGCWALQKPADGDRAGLSRWLPMTSDYIDLLHTSDLLALPPATWLMHTLIPEHGRVGLYGDPGGGKSFIALDWAMHISEGMSWLGRYPTKQAPVIYIAAEGGRGIQKRVREWMRFYGKQDLAAMYWLLEPLYVREEGVVQDFLDTLERRDIFPGLVVFDTLSRSMGNGDENGPDMAHFVDRVIHLASQRFMSCADRPPHQRLGEPGTRPHGVPGEPRRHVQLYPGEEWRRADCPNCPQKQ